jgi:hypothetical protein
MACKGMQAPTKSYRHSGRNSFWLLLIVLVSACQPAPILARSTPAPGEKQPLKYEGNGPSQITLRWDGPAVLHFTTGRATAPFQASLTTGLEFTQLVNANGPLDEYRGYEFGSSGQANLILDGDQDWTVTVLPVSGRYFQSLNIPGKYQGKGSAVLILEGKYGVATFNADQPKNFSAWAFGPNGVGEKLYFKPDGDYKGKSVLPKGAGWIVVSAAGAWSVDIQAPCCEVPPGF